MIKLETALMSYIVNDRFFKTNGRELIESNIPQNKAYKQVDGEEEWFSTSTGEWKGMTEVRTSYDDWKRFYHYPFNYLHHLFIKNPGMAKEGALNQVPRMMYFDIECATDGTGRFPRAENDPMIMFGYAIDDGPIKVHYISNYNERPAGFQDQDLITQFIETVAREDPDVIVSYNGYSFDIPYIITRARKMGIDLKPLLRTKVPSTDRLMDLQLYMEKVNGDMGGRIHYDIFHVDVFRDQKLSGIKDRKMKTIGKWFLKDIADQIVELEDGIQNTIGMLTTEEGLQRLIEYQKSDIMVTRGLAKIYFPLSIMAANEMSLPLNTVVNRSSGTLATVSVLKNILDERILPDKSNVDIFPEMYELIEKNKKKYPKEIKKSFQGAYVDIYKRGKFEKVWKLDFSSLYPSIIISFNLSYETVSFKTEEMTPLKLPREDSWQEFSFEKGERNLVLNIPDANYLRNLKVDIDFGKLGVLPRTLGEGLAKRDHVRKVEMKGLDKNSPEYIALDSKQNIIKVVNNSIYGVLANAHSIGYLPIGFTITGLGRHLIRKAIEIIADPWNDVCPTAADTRGELWSDEWKKTNPIIEIDTDGILINSEPDEQKVNMLLTEYIKETFGAKNTVLKMEKEEFGKGFIRGMKNYIVLKPNSTEPIIHGSSFKSSRAAPVVDRSVKLMIDHLMFDKRTVDEILDIALNFDNLPFDDFKMKVRMSKSISSYKSKGETHTIKVDDVETTVEEKGGKNISQMLVRIAGMYESCYGYVPQKGDVLEFIVVREITTGLQIQIPFNKLRSSTIYVLDREYYKDTIREMLSPILPDVVSVDNLDDVLEL